MKFWGSLRGCNDMHPPEAVRITSNEHCVMAEVGIAGGKTIKIELCCQGRSVIMRMWSGNEEVFYEGPLPTDALDFRNTILCQALVGDGT